MSEFSMTSRDLSKDLPRNISDVSFELSTKKRKRQNECSDFSYEELNDMSVKSLINKARLSYVDKTLNNNEDCLWLNAFIHLLNNRRETIHTLIAEDLKGKYTDKENIDVEIMTHDYWSRLHKEKLK